MVNDQEKEALRVLMAKAIGLAVDDISDSTIDTLILIGKGIHWDMKYDEQASRLASQVEEELSHTYLL